MATQIYTITAAPTNLLTANGIDGQPLVLVSGQTYSARFVAVGPQAICKSLAVPDGTAVDAADAALPVRNFEDLVIAPVAGESIYVWGDDAGQLVINNIP